MALEDDIAILTRAPLFNLLDRDALRLVAFAAENRDPARRATSCSARATARTAAMWSAAAPSRSMRAIDGSPATFVAGPAP